MFLSSVHSKIVRDIPCAFPEEISNEFISLQFCSREPRPRAKAIVRFVSFRGSASLAGKRRLLEYARWRTASLVFNGKPLSFVRRVPFRLCNRLDSRVNLSTNVESPARVSCRRNRHFRDRTRFTQEKRCKSVHRSRKYRKKSEKKAVSNNMDENYIQQFLIIFLNDINDTPFLNKFVELLFENCFPKDVVLDSV